MDTEQRAGLLAPTEEHLAQVKVFPLIPALRKDVTVRLNCLRSADVLTSLPRIPLVRTLECQSKRRPNCTSRQRSDLGVRKSVS